MTQDEKNKTATLTKTQTDTKVTTDKKTGDQISTTTRTTTTITVSTSDKNNGQVLGGTTQTTTTTSNLTHLSEGAVTTAGEKTQLSPLQAVGTTGESKLVTGLQDYVGPSMMDRLMDHKVGASGVVVGTAAGVCAAAEPCGAAVGTAALVGAGLYAGGAALYDLITH